MVQPPPPRSRVPAAAAGLPLLVAGRLGPGVTVLPADFRAGCHCRRDANHPPRRWTELQLELVLPPRRRSG